MYYGHYYAYSKSRSRLLRHVPSWATIILRQNVLRQKCFYARLIFYANFFYITNHTDFCYADPCPWSLKFR